MHRFAPLFALLPIVFASSACSSPESAEPAQTQATEAPATEAQGGGCPHHEGEACDCPHRAAEGGEGCEHGEGEACDCPHRAAEGCEHGEGEACDCPHRAAEGGEGCRHGDPEAAAESGEGEGRTFGAAVSEERELTELSAIMADPQSFAGQTVKTEGRITQVCQRMGCWMELSAEGVAPIMVPMAGHGFFLPRDVAGRHAVIEGEVGIRERSAAEAAHLESEGATATATTVQITATGVAIR